jgi:hypothetical protein
VKHFRIPSLPQKQERRKSGARAFSEDEYQACSGIGHGVDIKELVKSKDPARAKQTAEKLDLEGVLVLYGGRRGFQPPHNANKINGGL